MKNAEINIFTDGGSRGNPGASALGVYIEDIMGNHLFSAGKRIGFTTNNVAEYSAVLEAMDWIIKSGKSFSKINFYMDSNLVVSQINGLFKIKNEGLKGLFLSAKEKEKQIGTFISYTHIPREQNKKADALVNQALDNLI